VGVGIEEMRSGWLSSSKPPAAILPLAHLHREAPRRRCLLGLRPPTHCHGHEASSSREGDGAQTPKPQRLSLAFGLGWGHHAAAQLSAPRMITRGLGGFSLCLNFSS